MQSYSHQEENTNGTMQNVTGSTRTLTSQPAPIGSFGGAEVGKVAETHLNPDAFSIQNLTSVAQGFLDPAPLFNIHSEPHFNFESNPIFFGSQREPQFNFEFDPIFGTQPEPHLNFGPPVPAFQPVVPQLDEDPLLFNFNINPKPTVPTCTHCPATFSRHSERIRHEASVHGVNHQAFFCLVVGCPKNTGIPYTRSDKLTAHLWKKHANLGYTKRTRYSPTDGED